MTDEADDLGIEPEDLAGIISSAQAGADEVELDLTEAVGAVEPATGVRLRVTKCHKDSANSGAAVLKLEAVETEGPHAGHSFRRMYMLSGPGAGFTRDLIKALGFDLEAGAKRVPFSPSKALGREFLADITYSTKKVNGERVVDEQFNDIANPRRV
jgi:hypothetical protein